MSPTARTLKWLRDNYITAQVVEKIVPHSYIKQDLFGCIDIIALTPDRRILGIQTTTGDNHAARVTKAQNEPRCVEWLRCHGKYEVWSWRKSQRSKRWVRRRAKAYIIRATSDDVFDTVGFVEAEE
jgi:hypothetical protein